ncbi:ribonuclease 3-like protein 1 isoform X2 [Eutrema salsugineum]|uniref:ribonuclease 3-like protein 1 isoform X2 n=1 Tax=Eutrema salsugineum TaxID=72664 RepID=UPI000CED2E11|nr:ribonuclease 3-like protein 1 isoform X2 [Eutrema salsugineum]
MEDQKTKRISQNPSRSIISLKDIPPLDPSSIPTNSSPRPRTMTEPVNVAKQRFEEKSELKLKMLNGVEEDNVKSLSFSNIQIDPNSTRTVNIKQEKKLVPKPQEEEEEDTKQKPKAETKKGSAKLVLHEICSSMRWKPPVYECCRVDGPCHMRLDNCFGVFWGSQTQEESCG